MESSPPASQFSLLRKPRFWPLFVTQALGAFNDNLYKTTLVVALAYGVWPTGDWSPEMLVTLAAGLFIIPFVLCAPIGGDLADKYDKATVIQSVKRVEIYLVIAAMFALWFGNILFLLAVLLAFGVQSACFSPSKFSILPQHLKSQELIGGNALLNTGSFLAILAGTILGGLWGAESDNFSFVAGILILCAALGYISSLYIPEAPSSVPHIKIKWNVLAESNRILGYAAQQGRGVFPAILGISWFYFVGGTYLAQFPNFTARILYTDNIVLTLLMTVFSVGIALGGLINNRLLDSRIDLKYVPWAAFAIALFSLDLYAVSLYWPDRIGNDVIIWTAFLSSLAGWRIIFDLFIISMAGGVFVVPLNALVQDRVAPDRRARVLAGSTLMNAIFILASSVLAMIVFAFGYSVADLFALVAGLTLLAGLALRRINFKE